MKEAGCEGVFLGIESGSDEMLARMNKTARRKDYEQAISLFRAAEISTYASLIIGFPGETAKTVQETIDLLEEMRPDFFRAQLWYCDPITPIWDKRLEYDIQGSFFNWSHSTMDAKTACDWIDYLFLAVENSIWLPQHGFEQWSTFYLQRKGMTAIAIKRFLKYFNALVKEKLLYPGKREINPMLLKNLERSCQFDHPQHIEPDILQLFSGSSYIAAERFWLEEFSFVHQINGTIRESTAEEDQRLVGGSRIIDKVLLNQLGFAKQKLLPFVILAAYSVLLSRLSGQADTQLIIAIQPPQLGNVIPLRLHMLQDMSFKEFVQFVEQKYHTAMQYQLYAFQVLKSPLKTLEKLHPYFEAGFYYGERTVDRDITDLEEALRFYPDIGLILQMIKSEEDAEVRLLYKKGWYREETIEKLGSYLRSILEEGSKKTEIRLGQLMPGSRDYTTSAASDECETFRF